MKKVIIVIILLILSTGCSQEKQKKKDTREVSIVAEVKDLTSPTIILKEDDITIELNSTSFEPNDYLVSVSDNIDDKVKISITGKVDTSKEGTYKIKFMAKDSTGNIASKTLSVKVKGKEIPIQKSESQENTTPSQKAVTTSPVPNNSIPIPSNLSARQFLFTNGYTMPTGSNPATTACVAYMGQSSGGCYPVTDSSGIYLGMEYRP